MSIALGGPLRAAAVTIVLVALGATAVPAVAAAAEPAYAPLDRPGPALSVSDDQLAAALHCTPGVKDAAVEPVLLNPATGVTAEQNYSWNWEPALDSLGIPWCAYTAPHSTLDDIQVSGEYLVAAIRYVHALAGRRIAVMGHSQGGMSMRWALRFWPDTRDMVDDVIGFSGSNHGTTLAGGDCQLGCPPAVWQQDDNSRFIAALNSFAETFAGISYTEIWTHTDEVVQPAGSADTASAALHTGDGAITNVATQQLCSLDAYEHLEVGTVDPVAYALAVDALTHPGPADPSRVGRSVCLQWAMPGVDWTNPKTLQEILAGAPGLAAVVTPGLNLVGAPEVTAEPPTKCYVYADGCPGGSAAGRGGAISAAGSGSRAGASTAPRRRCAPTKPFTVHLPRGWRAPFVVTANGRRLHVRRAHGRRAVRVDPRGLLGNVNEAIVLRMRGRDAHGRRRTVVRRYERCSAHER